MNPSQEALSPEQIVERMRGLLAKATPGPWRAADWNVDDGPEPYTVEANGPPSRVWPDGISKIRVAELMEADNPGDDIALIVEAVNALPGLLDTITTQQARIAKLEGEKKATWKAVMMSVANESRACQDRVSKAFRQALNGGDDV